MDSGWNTSHSEFNASGRSFTNYNTLTSATSAAHHGASVEGILAADDDGSGVEGVADMADVRRYQTGSIFYESGWTELDSMLADAQSNGAVVVNQSWGFNTINADDLQAYINAYGSLLTTSGYVQ